MTRGGIAERMSELLGDRVPFVHVTVVRAEKPTSVRAGDAAIVLADGSIEGFVGGVCAEGSVRTAALQALADGESLLLRVLPESDEVFPAAAGAQVVTNPCLSGGGMEIFLEPLLPPPVLGLAGDTPIAHALRVLAGSLGFEVATPEEDGFADAVAVVVSSLGRGEHEPVRAALGAGVGFVGVVASHRRGSALLAELRLTQEERARVRTPVGLRIGARTAEEIALSIMAEVVCAIRTEGLTAPSPRIEPPRFEDAAGLDTPSTAVDPVCGMTVTIGADPPQLVRDGVQHWFCSPPCRDAFAARVEA
jgi:xanthine dehydrogenase accessory factor